MEVPVAKIAQLRRMIAEPTEAVYTDELLESIITDYALPDSYGEDPTIRSWVEGQLIETENENWSGRFDLNAAAAQIWSEKAAAVAERFDFTADGATLHTSQEYNQAVSMSKFYEVRASARTIKLVTVKVPDTQTDFPWVGNLPEGD